MSSHSWEMYWLRLSFSYFISRNAALRLELYKVPKARKDGITQGFRYVRTAHSLVENGILHVGLRSLLLK